MASTSTASGTPSTLDPSVMAQWRHNFHRVPELGFAVHRTAGVIADLLTSFGVDEVHRGVGQTGVVGVIRSGDASDTPTARAIGLRADMDALPVEETNTHTYRSTVSGAFHGCGHDGHSAMLLGAAQQLANARTFNGTVYLVFQPNEENGLGAQAMIDDGLLTRFPMNAIYGLHNKPGVPAGHFATRVGPMMSSEDLFEITIVGVGGHASMPHRLIDPVVIGAEIVLALQTIVSRSIPATEIAVVSVTEFITDGARNIVPGTVTIKGDCRTFSSANQDIIERRMREITEGAAKAHGATITVSYTHEFVPLVNTARETAVAIEAASRIASAQNVNADCDLITASEDFARYLKHIPGNFVDLGNGTEGACGSYLHNKNYDFNDAILETGAKYFVELVALELP